MRVLILKLGAIGDVIMSLPALAELKKQHPTAHITWIADKPVIPLLEATGLIDEVVVVRENALLTSGLLTRINEVATLWEKVAFRRFDLLIIGYADPKSQLLMKPVRSRIRRQFNRDGRHWQALLPTPGKHHTHEYIRLFTDVSYPNQYPVHYPALRLTQTDFFPSGRPVNLIALAPGGAKSDLQGDGWLRRWPIESYRELAIKLNQAGYAIALIGGKDDAWVNDFFTDLPIYNFIGSLSILDTIACLSTCRLLVTHDCGPLHFTALAKIPAIGLFGPTNPIEKIPFFDGTSFLWGGEHLSCRPCYDGKTYAPCKANTCITSIAVDTVYRAISLKITQPHETQIN